MNQEFQNFENQKVPRSMILHLKAQAEFHELWALFWANGAPVLLKVEKVKKWREHKSSNNDQHLFKTQFHQIIFDYFKTRQFGEML